MARGDQLIRQWRLIEALISSKQGKTTAELAGELDCHRRTVYRDLDTLQAVGFPIYTEKEGGKSLWRILDGAKHRIPLSFTLPELMALYFSCDMMRVFQGTVFHDSLESLFQKIKGSLPPESIRFLEDSEQILHLAVKPSKPYAQFREIIKRVCEAAANKKSIEILYYTMSRKRESRRRVDPYRIWFFNGTLYLIGYCHRRGEVRIFALDRIKMLNETEDSFEIPEDFSMDRFLGASFGIFRGEPIHVKIWFSAEVAEYIEEKIWHENQKIRKRKDGSIIFEALVAGGDEIKFWTMSWGAHAAVLEPKALRDDIMREVERMLKSYARASGRALESRKERLPARRYLAFSRGKR